MQTTKNYQIFGLGPATYRLETIFCNYDLGFIPFITFGPRIVCAIILVPNGPIGFSRVESVLCQTETNPDCESELDPSFNWVLIIFLEFVPNLNPDFNPTQTDLNSNWVYIFMSRPDLYPKVPKPRSGFDRVGSVVFGYGPAQDALIKNPSFV